MAILNLDELKRNESRHIMQIIMEEIGAEIASDSQDLKHFHRNFFLLLTVSKLLLLVNQVDHVRA